MSDRHHANGIDALKAALDRIPRVRLASLPSPLHHCGRLSRLLGGPQIYMKRDDLTGLAMGGNKVRKLEFILADVLEKQADVLITGSTELQANHCAATAAAAAVLGLDVHLILSGNEGEPLQGNPLLSHVFGADMTFVDSRDFAELESKWQERAEVLRRKGRNPYIVNLRRETDVYGAVAYANFTMELIEQLEMSQVRPNYIYLASDRGTQAGIEVGIKATDASFRVIGVGSVREDRSGAIAELACRAAKLLGLSVELAAVDIVNLKAYTGEDPEELTEASREAIKILARAEGILLDPVYTGRAAAALIDHVREGQLTAQDAVVFVHTGGTAALFAYSKELLAGLQDSSIASFRSKYQCQR